MYVRYKASYIHGFTHRRNNRKGIGNLLKMENLCNCVSRGTHRSILCAGFPPVRPSQFFFQAVIIVQKYAIGIILALTLINSCSSRPTKGMKEALHCDKNATRHDVIYLTTRI